MGGGGGGNGNNGGGNNDYDNGNYNTYGLSPSFLEGLGVQGPLHTKVFVANVSIVFFFSFWLEFVWGLNFVDHANLFLVFVEDLCCLLSHVVLSLDWISLFFF